MQPPKLLQRINKTTAVCCATIFFSIIILLFFSSSNVRNDIRLIRRLQFTNTDRLSVCKQHGYLILLSGHLARALVVDANTGVVLAHLEKSEPQSANGSQFKEPYGIACDEAHNRILVSDSGHLQIKVFNIDNFALIQTVNTQARLTAIAVDTAHNHVFAIGDNVVNILDPDSLLSSAPSFGRGSDTAVSNNFPTLVDLAVDERNGHLLVDDYGDSVVTVYDLDKLTPLGTIGRYLYNGTDNLHLNENTSVAVDAKGRNIFIADLANHRVQVFDAITLNYTMTIRSKYILVPGQIIIYKDMLFIKDYDPENGVDHINVFAQPN